MLSFSTDDIRPQDRFDHWCEVRGKSLFGVTIELEREKRADFHGRFSATPIGNAVLAEMTASSYRVSRTPADIARVSSDSLSIGLQIRGPGWMKIKGDRVHLVREGDVTISHANMMFAGTPERSDGFDFRTLKIPLTNDLALGARTHDLFPEPLMQGARLTRLIKATLSALEHDPFQASGEIESIARLALIARGRLAQGSLEGRAALRAGFLHAAREIMIRDLHRPDLSSATVAAELAISLRQVHVLFEPTGLSFARTLTAMRLKEARRLLGLTPARQVADIAYACGFDSIATFYRVFRSAYGMTPGDIRAMSLNA
ncbi:MAG TPA: AraC family transcriptional regulator [Afipia sp.]|uniref:AraC family transcriptional regulator n=1 Tax=unclassified Afipia TaxID=2642050 RepID=UPI00046463E4|nr:MULTISPECIES: AraC family transcriptional regulator [unclassified Afipia]MAH67925.1 AraC family transcriptional regulator [Afipia sp.]OUX62779.1 MAG: AraC family transcriptional regulator [Afipia sp. TMED4]HAO40096.1 AraC family transcriptional regulator [Afipia sp.]HAP09428.1 AraC family transcriptional regulator [Afipia sp.]HAP48915.1 AraC family transcriptional regulator [Afipia sp.]